MNIITLKEKIQTLESIFGESIHARSGKNITVKCPNCGNKKSTNKKKLSICLDSGRYHCWVCELKGKNILKVAKKYEKNNKNIFKKLEKYFKKLTIDDLTEENKIVMLPNDFKLLYLSKSKFSNIAKNYLHSRGIDHDQVWKYKIGISNNIKFTNRVIFPSFDSDLNLNFYQTRTYDKKIKIPYKNCDINKKEIIFNENFINWSKPLVLVEGVFDAMKIQDNVCCILGSWIDESFLLFQKIVKNKTPVILALDSDASDKIIKIANNLKRYCIDVKIIKKSKKDLGDMSFFDAKKIINEAERFDNTNRLRYLIKDIKSGSIF